MSIAQRRMLLVGGCLIAVLLVTVASADTVVRSGRAKGMTFLTVTVEGNDLFVREVWEVQVILSGGGRVASVAIPAEGDNWSVVVDTVGGIDQVTWTTNEPLSSEGAGGYALSLGGFGIKMKGKVGMARWVTVGVDSPWGDAVETADTTIRAGDIKLKGKM